MNHTRWLTLATTATFAAVIIAAVALMPSASAAPAAVPFDYTVTNEAGIRFADDFYRLGGPDTLGLPASYRFILPDGFTYQLTQGAMMQWWRDRNGVMLANTFQFMEERGLDEWLYNFKGVPRPIKNDGSGGDWQKARDIRLTWLTDEAIKARYLANPNPAAIPDWNVDRSIELYGLPMSYPEKRGPFVAQRFQRIALQLWVEGVPGMPPKGTVVRVLGGDMLKEAGLVPPEALHPDDRAALATATPTPTATSTPGTPTPVPTGTAAATGTTTSTPTTTPGGA